MSGFALTMTRAWALRRLCDLMAPEPLLTERVERVEALFGGLGPNSARALSALLEAIPGAHDLPTDALIDTAQKLARVACIRPAAESVRQ